MASYFVSLASAIVYRLIFSTILTLVITPTMLVLPNRLGQLVGIYIKPHWEPVRDRALTALRR